MVWGLIFLNYYWFCLLVLFCFFPSLAPGAPGLLNAFGAPPANLPPVAGVAGGRHRR